MAKRRPRPDWQADALQAIAALKAGKLLLHPTDTVWGLAAMPTDESALRSMNRLKGRAEETPLLLLVADEGSLDRLLPDLPEGAWSLIETSDRPVTLVGSPKLPHSFPPMCYGSDGRLAVRWVQDDPYTQFVIRGVGGVLASTSANAHGTETPKRMDDLSPAIRAGVGHVADHRRSEVLDGRPSMMVGFDQNGRFSLLRD